MTVERGQELGILGVIVGEIVGSLAVTLRGRNNNTGNTPSGSTVTADTAGGEGRGLDQGHSAGTLGAIDTSGEIGGNQS
jgi:hypothetical protein